MLKALTRDYCIKCIVWGIVVLPLAYNIYISPNAYVNPNVVAVCKELPYTTVDV